MDLRERQRAFLAQRINGPAQLPPPLVGDGDPTHLDLPRKIQIPFATVSLTAAAVYPDSDTSPPAATSPPNSHHPATPPVRTPEHRLAFPPCSALRKLGSRYPKPYTIASWARSVVGGVREGVPSRPPPASTTPPTLAKWASQIPPHSLS
jgi:hypothetical protein